jgi:hypothetical protein
MKKKLIPSGPGALLLSHSQMAAFTSFGVKVVSNVEEDEGLSC